MSLPRSRSSHHAPPGSNSLRVILPEVVDIDSRTCPKALCSPTSTTSFVVFLIATLRSGDTQNPPAILPYSKYKRFNLNDDSPMCRCYRCDSPLVSSWISWDIVEPFREVCITTHSPRSRVSFNLSDSRIFCSVDPARSKARPSGGPLVCL